MTEDEQKNGGRKGAAFEDTKYLSQEAEWFLAGVLTGLSDGQPIPPLEFQPTWTLIAVVVPMMCPTINSYKRLLGGEVSSFRPHGLCGVVADEIRQCGLLIPLLMGTTLEQRLFGFSLLRVSHSLPLVSRSESQVLMYVHSLTPLNPAHRSLPRD